jgi:5'-deoxynucleotidase YfbR-like HD superfamily hydrolase
MMEPYFTEFEAGDSDAARITHEADSLECRIQAVIYILRYPRIEKLLEFLESLPKAVYFQDLTNLLSKEENSLREKQLQLTIIFVIGTCHQSFFPLLC